LVKWRPFWIELLMTKYGAQNMLISFECFGAWNLATRFNPIMSFWRCDCTFLQWLNKYYLQSFEFVQATNVLWNSDCGCNFFNWINLDDVTWSSPVSSSVGTNFGTSPASVGKKKGAALGVFGGCLGLFLSFEKMYCDMTLKSREIMTTQSSI